MKDIAFYASNYRLWSGADWSTARYTVFDTDEAPEGITQGISVRLGESGHEVVVADAWLEPGDDPAQVGPALIDIARLRLGA